MVSLHLCYHQHPLNSDSTHAPRIRLPFLRLHSEERVEESFYSHNIHMHCYFMHSPELSMRRDRIKGQVPVLQQLPILGT